VTIVLEATAETVRIAVADTGIGIPEEEQAFIGQRLYRSRNARGEKGLGLGMSIAKAIVAAHGGQLTFTSALGRGSTFVAAFPARAVSEGNPTPSPPASHTETARRKCLHPCLGCRIVNV
jgi:signal transduction histidine kinase